MPGVAVRFRNGTGEHAVETTLSGLFTGQVVPGNWEIRPSRLENIAPSQDSSDAAAVLEASVGMITMPAPIFLAADVSGNGDVTAYDAALILRRIEGDNQPFPAALSCGSEWAFVPEAASVPNQVSTSPVMAPGNCTPGNVSYLPLAGNASGQSFSAILFGDVNGSWHPGDP